MVFEKGNQNNINTKTLIKNFPEIKINIWNCMSKEYYHVPKNIDSDDQTQRIRKVTGL